MKLRAHLVHPARGAKHLKKKLGRGNASGHGTYSGRGGKGQSARSGGSAGLALKGFKFLMQQTPKLRGFKSFARRPAEVYLSDLEKHFADGATVTVAALKEKNLIPAGAVAAKVLNTGTLDKKLVLTGIAATKTAAEKIVKSGGSVK